MTKRQSQRIRSETCYARNNVTRLYMYAGCRHADRRLKPTGPFEEAKARLEAGPSKVIGNTTTSLADCAYSQQLLKAPFAPYLQVSTTVPPANNSN